MAKEPSRKPGGTNRAAPKIGEWPKCEVCGRFMWLKPGGTNNSNIMGKCEVHGPIIHYPSPQAEPNPAVVLSEEISETT